MERGNGGKMFQSEGYDPYADIRGDSKGSFKTDLKFGKVGEDDASMLAQAMLDGWVEVKSDAFGNGNIFIELAHCLGRKTNPDGSFVWTKSGLNVTQAKFWMYLKLSPGGVFRSALILETSRLNKFRSWYKDKNGTSIMAPGSKSTGYMIGNANGETPTLGLRIVSSDLSQIMYNKDWDEQ